jgi:hypothetical protein
MEHSTWRANHENRNINKWSTAAENLGHILVVGLAPQIPSAGRAKEDKPETRELFARSPSPYYQQRQLRVKRSPMTATHSLTNQLATLFKGSETWLGVFYPRKYIIATFSSFETALSGKQALRAAGLGPDEIRAVSGGEMLHFFREMQARTGLLGDLMTEFSRFIGTEASFFDRDVWEARHGAGFLAVHCSTEKEADYIRHRLTPLRPVSMQWYRTEAVESLI